MLVSNVGNRFTLILSTLTGTLEASSKLGNSRFMMQVAEEELKKAVLRALLDDQSRVILTSTMLVPKSVVEITREQKIPVTSAYRKVKELKEFGLLKVERIIITDDGKKYELVKSAIKTATVQLDRETLDVNVTANVDADEKMVKRFFTLKEVR
ncbi:MAG TPA: hypothetical protein VJZ75_01405 [Candidatus Bathyarchaeia archaeon]|nr:hypothetical protein [Candidatus Bathyarchaeia archaeon]